MKVAIITAATAYATVVSAAVVGVSSTTYSSSSTSTSTSSTSTSTSSTSTSTSSTSTTSHSSTSTTYKSIMYLSPTKDEMPPSATGMSIPPTMYNPGSGGKKDGQDCPFVPNANEHVLLADTIFAVSKKYPDEAFLRMTDSYIVTPGDFALASSFTIPDIAAGLNCSLNFVVPTADQINGDLNQVLFSGDGNFMFAQVGSDGFPSEGLTFNTLGNIIPTGTFPVIPGTNLQLVNFPCPPPGTQLPGLISSDDTTLFMHDAFGPICPSGLLVVIEGAP